MIVRPTLAFALALAGAAPAAAPAATVAPPMLDITRQCNAMARKNATLMSECVVAESEARADLLAHWAKLPDDAVERCIKQGRKARRQPYVAMQKCLSADIAAAGAAPAQGDTKPGEAKPGESRP